MTDAALTRLARFVAEDPLDCDAETAASMRDGVIDTLGCIHIGAKTELAKKARAAVQAMAPEGPLRVIGTDMRTARPQAAFLNAVAGHALDFDDWEIPGNTHPTIVLLTALLALAGPETRGSDLARAYLAGYEVIARLGEALNFEHYDAGWHTTATLGAPGAAAACARLLALSAEETANALSLAVSAATGYTCQFGSDAKPVQAGFAARAGVEAACLASVGLTGQSHVLDHRRGMAQLMGGLDRDRLAASLDKLGKTYALSEHGLVLKPWPSCGYTHRIMTCALRMRDRLTPASVAKIDLHLPDFHAAVLPFQQPAGRAEAMFSVPFVAAMGLVEGELTLADLEAQVWRRPDLARLIGKTEVHPFSPLRPGSNYSQDDPDRMVVTLADGTRFEETCVYPLGAPQSPMDADQLWSKFIANAGPASKAWQLRLGNWRDEPAIYTLFCEQGSFP